jgi:diacylglycerol kinase family enzyme
MDIGLGGLIAKRVNTYRRGLTAIGAYHRAVISILPFYRKTSMRVIFNNHEFSGPMLSVVIANGKWFGKGMGIAPEAITTDGKLDTIVLAQVGFWQYLAYLDKIFHCKPINHPQVFYDTATNLIISGEETPIQLDGEYVGHSPASIRIIPNAIRLLVG